MLTKKEKWEREKVNKKGKIEKENQIKRKEGKKSKKNGRKTNIVTIRDVDKYHEN